MVKNRFGFGLAVREHMLAGNPITRLEALILFGLSNLTAVISQMRREGNTIHSRQIPFLAAVRRVNQFAVLKPPANLPARDLVLTEYWLVR